MLVHENMVGWGRELLQSRRWSALDRNLNRMVQGGGTPLPEAARVELLDEVRTAGSTQLGKVKEIAYVRPALIV